jgi:hypothetical protein
LKSHPKSYEVRWSESPRDMSGAPLDTSHWEARLEILPEKSQQMAAADRRKPLILQGEKMERATGVEPATSSLGTNPCREIRGTTETNRAKFLDFSDLRQPLSDPIFRQFPAE